MEIRNLVDIRLHQNDLPDLAVNDYFFSDYLYQANGEILCDFCKISFILFGYSRSPDL